MKREFRFAGIGGQGMVLIGKILAKAMGIYQGLNVVESSSYSAAVRGGLTWSDVIVSDREVNDVASHQPDYLIIAAKKALEANRNVLAEAKLVVLEKYTVGLDQGEGERNNFYLADFFRMAKDVQVPKRSINIIMLGALCGGSGIVELGALEQGVETMVKRETENNLKALRHGFSLLEKHH